MTKANVRTQCCFCGNDIARQTPDPVELTIEFPQDDEPISQSLYCHYDCLTRTVHKSVPLYPAK
jgi:hypothetical protein